MRQNATVLASTCFALVVFAGLAWTVYAAVFVWTPTTDGWLEAGATVMSVPLAGQLPWFALMAGVGIYAIWQATPAARHTELHGRLRLWVFLLVVCNALWLGLLRRDELGAALLASLALLAVLLRLVMLIDRAALAQSVDRWITRACFGMFTGWLAVIVLAHSVVWLAARGVDTQRLMFKGGCALVLLLFALVVCAATFIKPMGVYVNAGALWVVASIAVDRFTWQDASPMFAIVASVAALLMLLCLVRAVGIRLRRNLSSH